MKLTHCLVTLSMTVLAASLPAADTAPATRPAGDIYSPAYISTIMRKVADAALINQTSPNINKENDWSIGALRTGVTGVYRVTNDEKYLKSNLAWGDATNWKLKNPADNADDQCAGQTYCEMYLLNPTPENEHMFAGTKQVFDNIVLKPGFRGSGLWGWQDALYMSPPVIAMLGKITKNNAYYDALANGLKDAADKLYDTDRHLWYWSPNAGFKKTPKGNPKFWGPGNAWVLAGLRRCLNYIPDDYPRRGEIVKYYKDLCQAVAEKQQPDGFWRTSLWEPTEFPNPEASCTSFFTYAIATGILTGELDEKTYRPVVQKSWAALVTVVDEKTGKVGRCQPWSNSPGGAGKDHNTPEGTGAFLLAGQAMHQLATRDATQPAATKPAEPAK